MTDADATARPDPAPPTPLQGTGADNADRFLDEVARLVDRRIAEVIAPLEARLAALERRVGVTPGDRPAGPAAVADVPAGGATPPPADQGVIAGPLGERRP